ncbi:hypothetical protein AB833_08575 [Chromatiales bacterium (ex Bugula neritina AB1)]|nr:hypothetical protein AB833_08575 [Chromatiales bacterium (ex Bugula neritina AB1)]
MFVFTLVIALILFLTGTFFRSKIEALTPPYMRPADIVTAPARLDQGWTPDISDKYHSISQGTRTLPVPLSWLRALEAPRSNPFALFFGSTGKFLDDDYILRFGFIKSEGGPDNRYNPYGLPLGFAVTPEQKLPGIRDIEDAVGFTCAACHTSHLTLPDGNKPPKHYLIEGGPAVTDLGNLTKALAAALGQTFVSSKLPILNGRFDRFAEGVLGDNYSYKRKLELKQELQSLVKHLAGLPSDVNVVEGFTRLDALNRIGNQTFAIDYERYENYVAPNAPVNYPHIWTAPWFDWVQYDGSIMAPLIRNAGEALGVSAYVNMSAPKTEGKFSSSVDIKNLIWIEDVLSGEKPPEYQAEATDDSNYVKVYGLQGPKWPDDFPAIDKKLADDGRALYKALCKDCHLPPMDEPEFWEQFKEIEYYGTEKSPKKLKDKLLTVTMVPLSQIGTDPAQARVLMKRRVNTAGNNDGPLNESTWGMGLDTTVCVEEPKKFKSPNQYEPESVATTGYAENKDYDQGKDYPYAKLVEVPISDGPNVPFATALGALVQEVNDQWFENNFIPEEHQKEYEDDRPNCLRSGKGYKARPLNGIWATAPYLHNGSIATVDELLGKPEDRSRFVQLGTTRFDAEKMGVYQDDDLYKKAEQNPDARYIDGYFILNTELAGNSNAGHVFSDEWDEDAHWSKQVQGVIGPELKPADRAAIIEFLKTQ